LIIQVIKLIILTKTIIQYNQSLPKEKRKENEKKRTHTLPVIADRGR
jgi:hypothetical protein